MSAERSDELRTLVNLLDAADPVPLAAVQAARSALSLGDVDAALAELVYDSRKQLETAGLRGGSGMRELSFEAGDMSIEVDVSADGARLTGQLIPAGVRQLHVESRSSSTPVVVDPLGRFECAWTERHFRLRVGTSPSTLTPWVNDL